eukprot:gene7888-5513_t
MGAGAEPPTWGEENNTTATPQPVYSDMLPLTDPHRDSAFSSATQGKGLPAATSVETEDGMGWPKGDAIFQSHPFPKNDANNSGGHPHTAPTQKEEEKDEEVVVVVATKCDPSSSRYATFLAGLSSPKEQQKNQMPHTDAFHSIHPISPSGTWDAPAGNHHPLVAATTEVLSSSSSHDTSSPQAAPPHNGGTPQRSSRPTASGSHHQEEEEEEAEEEEEEEEDDVASGATGPQGYPPHNTAEMVDGTTASPLPRGRRHRAAQYTLRFLHRFPTLSPVLSAAVVELIGSFFLVLSVPLSATHDTELAPLAVGFMALTMIISMSYLSGGHFNPAVSLSVYLCSVEEEAGGDGVQAVIRAQQAQLHHHQQTGGMGRAGTAAVATPAADRDGAAPPAFCPYAHLTFHQFTVYLAAQLCGGFLAAMYSFTLFGVSMDVPSHLVTTQERGRDTIWLAARVLLAEALYTFVLCSVVLHVAVHQEKAPRVGTSGVSAAAAAAAAVGRTSAFSGKSSRVSGGYQHPSQHFYGFAMGLALVSAQLAVGAVSGAALNPAVIAPLTLIRCLFSFSGDCCGAPIAWLAIYIPSELMGSVVAAMAYVALHHRRPEEEAEEEEEAAGWGGRTMGL